MNIQFIALNELNMNLAKQIESEVIEFKFLNHIIIKEYSWIVYNKNVPIGITGFYESKDEINTVWLNKYGVLPKFRNKGFGEKIFLKTIEVAKQKNYRCFKIISSNKHCLIANKIFNKIMDFKEPYTHDLNMCVYTKSLLYSATKEIK